MQLYCWPLENHYECRHKRPEHICRYVRVAIVDFHIAGCIGLEHRQLDIPVGDAHIEMHCVLCRRHCVIANDTAAGLRTGGHFIDILYAKQ